MSAPHTSGSRMYFGTFGCTQDAPLRESSEQSPLLGPSEGSLSVGTPGDIHADVRLEDQVPEDGYQVLLILT